MYRWIALVFALSVVGCSSAPTLPAHPSHVVGQAKIGDSGGTFIATDSGTELNGLSCILGQRQSFSGTGSGTFLHAVTENGFVEWSHDFTCNVNGSATLVSTFHPKNTVNVALTAGHQLCGGGFSRAINFRVTSGTGRFAHATGSGTVTFSCHTGGTYTDKWSGTLHF